MRNLGDKALDALLWTRRCKVLQHGGMISFPGPLLARRPWPGYIHGSTQLEFLQRLDLHVDLRVHNYNTIMFSAEWYSLFGILSRNDDIQL